MYDIAIIGLGPAGATLARLLDPSFKVIAIDQKDEKRKKCCGGLLSPDAQKILAKFNLNLPKDVLVDPQIFSVRTIDIKNKLERFYQRFYLNIDRGKFDEFLISKIPSQVSIKLGTCFRITKEPEYYEVHMLENNIKVIIKAKIVIGADGANSIVRNTFYKDKKSDRYVAIQEWYQEENKTAYYSCIFDQTITPSYAWTVSKDQYLIIGGAFPKDECHKRFKMLKEQLQQRGFVFGEKIKKEGCFVVNNKGFKTICTGRDNAYLIGEAAGMISPSSLEGISYAMDSADILARIMNQRKNITKQYMRKTIKIRLKLTFKLFKKPFMYNRWLRKGVMFSNIGSIKKNKSSV